jgi:XTP/dITP diphosphohydrolase
VTEALSEKPSVIVIATHNDHKVPEFISALDLPGTEFFSLKQWGITESAVEDGDDFRDNAWIKAGFAFARTKATCIADDSGIEVDALDGVPGVHSARYAGENATDEQNNSRLLRALAGLPQEERRARFVSEVALIASDGSLLAARGTCEGRIADAPRGVNGFGYDCIFIPDEPGDGRTMAELSAVEKNAISHRGRALRELRAKLLRQFSEVDRFAVNTADETLLAPSGHIPVATLAATKAAAEIPAKVRLAVFDFDGTLLEGASPVRLIRFLLTRRILPISVGWRAAKWGARYKMHLPVEQADVRGFLFEGLSSLSANQIHDLMVDLYRRELRPLLKQDGIDALEKARQEGKHIVLVSASFRPFLHELAFDLQADFFVSTEMEIRGGTYTGRVSVAPPEGVQKLLQLKEKADSLYGEGNWVLDSAYGDHRSDEQILSAALNPCVIDPDSRLRLLAYNLDWPIRIWK